MFPLKFGKYFHEFQCTTIANSNPQNIEGKIVALGRVEVLLNSLNFNPNILLSWAPPIP